MNTYLHSLYNPNNCSSCNTSDVLSERVFNQAQRSYNNNLNTCLKYTSHAQIERMKNYSNHFYNNNNNNNNNNSNNNSNNLNRNFNLNLNLNYNDNSVPQRLSV